MARTRTLAQLRDDVCDRANITDGGTTGRHTSSRLNRYINQAIQKYVTVVSAAGGQDWYMKRTGVLTMNASQTRDASGWAPYMYIPLPADFFQLIGIDLIVAGQAISLVQYEQAERNVFQANPWLQGNSVGQPVFYRIAGPNSTPVQVVEVIPFAGSAYQYEILYVPEVTDLSSDSDTFDGRAGFEEYVIDSAALNVLLNDGNTENALYSTIKLDRDEMESEMKFKFATMAGPGRRLDTQSLRERISRYARGDIR